MQLFPSLLGLVHLVAVGPRISGRSTIFLSDASQKQAQAYILTEADELNRLREGAEGWLGLCSAITLSDGQGLQPFSSPSGWLADISPPPAQAYTQVQLLAEIERHEPALHKLFDACADRAPSLCSVSNLLPLARLAAWTSGRWVRSIEEWEGQPSKGDTDLETTALRGLVSHLLELWDVPEALHGALTYR